METLKSGNEFSRVFTSGRRANHPLVRVCVASCDEGTPGKVAFVAAKRFGNAVWRNRSKRVLREAARQAGMPAAGKDVIFFATSRTHDAHPAQVAEAIQELRRRARF